ncbi:MAG TPA: tetratricopeptide repeat protein, partial [Candidatus Elarobacter sp.]
GFTYLRLKRYEEARRDLDAALAIEPTLPEALYARGIVKLRTGDVAGGNVDVAAARALDAHAVEAMIRYRIVP